VELTSITPSHAPNEQDHPMTPVSSPITIAPLALRALDVRTPDEREPARPPGRRAPVARCADGHGTMTGLFFSDDLVDIARAKAMCGLCPLQVSCLAGAIEREEPWGVWGGELLSGGRIVTSKRACGRPPKHPRPAVVIDELGPVPVAVA
jgi:WhiB family redox-sensing transcriptional regulator